MPAARFERQLALLGNARFRLLFLATFASGVGNWLALIALQIDVYDRTESGWWVGALLIANILPAVFIGLLLGPLVDRFSRKGLMIASDVGRLGVFAALPFVDSVGGIVVLATLAGVGNAFFRPAVLAGLPNLVDDEELPTANALLQLVEWTTTAVGPLLGGAIVAASSPDVAYFVNAVTFGISALLVLPIPARLLQSDRPIGRGHWRQLSEGFEIVRSSPALLCVLVAWSVVMVASGIVNVAEIFLAKSSYDSGDLGFGLLWTGSGIGLIVGGLSATRMIQRDLPGAYVRLLAIFAIGVACAAAAPNVWVGVVAMMIAGFGNGGAVVANITLVQRGAPDYVRGRAFTLLMSVNYAVLGLAFVVAGPLTDAGGARWAYAVAAAVIVVAMLLAARILSGEASTEDASTVPEAAEPSRSRATVTRGEWSSKRLVDGVRAGDVRALARAITLVENRDPVTYELVRKLYPATGRAHAVGFTGPPGVGKSTIVSALVGVLRARGKTVGVVSVDPSSPFTAGAVLGDRIRLAEHFTDPGVFIRSMGTRGHVGGLAEATLQALLLLDAAGKDVVFLETVGTGQSEVGIVAIADIVVLALMPGSGDAVQALKAGIMEIPDVIVVNKADHPLAASTASDVRQVLALAPDGPQPPVVLTDALRGEGIEALWGEICGHRTSLEASGELELRRRRNLAAEVFAVASARARRHLENAVAGDPELALLLDRVERRELDPLTAVRTIMETVFHLPDGDQHSPDTR